MKINTLKIPFLLAAALPVFSSIANAQPLISQDLRVSAPGHAFVTGTGTSATATTELAWYNTSSGAQTSLLNGSATLTVGGTTTLATSGPNMPARFSLNETTAPTAYWTVDLGTNLLVSDVAGYNFQSSSISVIDFGGGDISNQYFDFTVGLWDGSSLTLASSLSDLSFSINAASDGAVSHLGGNWFRFSESGTDSGTDLIVSSNIAGQHVRSLETVASRVSIGIPMSESIALGANRTLSQVPEPSGALLVGLVGLRALLSRRRTA